jgi:hypothetical protein
MHLRHLGTLLCLAIPCLTRAERPATFPEPIVWTTPSTNAAGSLYLGNGQLGINLWVESNGDLLFYLGRNDALSEISQLCKVGRVRVSISPNPFTAGAPFRQELSLRDGVCEISAGPPKAAVRIRVFVDAAHPVVHVVGESDAPVLVSATVDSWRTARQKIPAANSIWTLGKAPFDLWQSADQFPPSFTNAVVWYHHNEESTAFESTVEVQSLQSIRGTLRDPILHRTFGGWVTGPGFKVGDARGLATPARTQSFRLRVASPSVQAPTVQEWMDRAREDANASADADQALARTVKSWNAFWDRSWVVCDVTARAAIPENSHPLRVGHDSNGGSRFPGRIGGATVHPQILASNEIARIAAGPPATNATAPGLDIPAVRDGLTLEAWVRPERLVAGRILDKLTAGAPDGFLLDTHPGDTVRFSVGAHTITARRGLLRVREWQHVAATLATRTGEAALYLNGTRVAHLNSTLRAAGSTRHSLFLGGDTIADDALNLSVGRAHTLQRYMQACAGRGPYPIKFNGSIFTVEPNAILNESSPDWRRWGDCHWWQNLRMPYHAMQAAGDFDLMMPLFDLFESIRPFAEARAQLYHQARGCYFAETMTVWGTYANRDYGWDRTNRQPNDVDCKYWRFAWNQGLELVALMLDYFEYTGDSTFLQDRLLPMASSVLAYFDSRFPKDDAGRIVLTPTQAVETYWFGVTNDTPSVAGLNDVTQRLCRLPANAMTREQRTFFEHMKAAAPELPVESAVVNGVAQRRIGVAQFYNPKRSNVENPELFPIWPFRLCGLGRPLLDEARTAYRLRGNTNDVGWGYDANAAALLGLTSEASRMVLAKLLNSRPGYRWPATWGPNYDWLPDHCHGGNLMATINYMLIQHSGDRILLLPAWPKTWDVTFKLHAPRQTTVEGRVAQGKLASLRVTPESRRRDIVIPREFQ